jgi:hypothetical protein
LFEVVLLSESGVAVSIVNFADLLQPRRQHFEIAELFDDRVRLLCDQGLKLGNLRLVVALGVKGDRLPTEALHFVDDALIGHQVPVVVGADGRDADALALQGQLGGRDGAAEHGGQRHGHGGGGDCAGKGRKHFRGFGHSHGNSPP